MTKGFGLLRGADREPESGGIAVVGGGPAGLAAAERLSGAGHPVTVYDRMPSVGRKLLMAGRGGLNLTHSEPLDLFLARYGAARERLEPLIRRFGPGDLRAWAGGLGEETFVGSSGRVFPRAFKASPLLRAWLRRLDGQGVRFALRRTLVGIGADGSLRFADPQGGVAVARPVAAVLALGGASWPRLGADGGFVPLLEECGVRVTPLRPANMGLRIAWSDLMRARFEGEPLKRIALRFGDRTVRGEAVITAAGLEGGAVYALSSPLRESLARDGAATLLVDLRPDLAEDAIAKRLAAAAAGSKASLSTRLRKAAGLAPVAAALLREGGSLPADAAALARRIKAMPLAVSGVQDLSRAISTAGGVAWSEVDGDLMLRAVPGLFVAGEMLDWEAPTGGYLLQACFSSGIAAAEGALARLGAAH